MTENEVRQFLKDNGWIQDATMMYWHHPAILRYNGAADTIYENFLIMYPDKAFGLAKNSMNNNNIPIVKMPQASLPMGITVAQQAASALGGNQTITFNYTGGLSPRNQYILTTDPESGIQIRTYHENKCDCGAVKCKTTHSHWCSTQMKGNQNGR